MKPSAGFKSTRSHLSPVMMRPHGIGDLLRRFQRDGVIPDNADVGQLATGLVAVVQGGYLLAQTARDVAPMASAIDTAIAHLSLLARERDERR
jgi:hypothetical protein